MSEPSEWMDTLEKSQDNARREERERIVDLITMTSRKEWHKATDGQGPTFDAAVRFFIAAIEGEQANE
jgi:hypothetical protein